MNSANNPYGGNPYGATYGQASGQGNTSVTYNTSAETAAPAEAEDSAGALSSLAGFGSSDSAAGLIKDTTTAGFAADVISESRNQPVLVDFGRRGAARAVS